MRLFSSSSYNSVLQTACTPCITMNENEPDWPGAVPFPVLLRPMSERFWVVDRRRTAVSLVSARDFIPCTIILRNNVDSFAYSLLVLILLWIAYSYSEFNMNTDSDQYYGFLLKILSATFLKLKRHVTQLSL
ncbi:hypothetical protein CEXT_803521 [Caerostris extrusa]|uniref:Uncharacterized protein n=1 Tax=Caerostris extrusa TaxID=172846 RepID=A0AAV4VX12_CAEEX|nr:hypothetical protein CEXT_803521 [Caerostris extrusa]